MKLFSRLRDHRFCAFCKSQRKIYVKKHVDLTNVALGTSLSMATGWLVFGEPDPRILILFCISMIASEIFIYTRWRASLACRMCGFDPVTYRRSPAQASSDVRAFFDTQMKNPEFLLTRSPLLGLQRALREQESRSAQRAARLKRIARPRQPAPTSTSLAPQKTL